MAHKFQITAPTVINACTSTTGWAASSGSLSLAACSDNRYGSTPFLKVASGNNTAVVLDLTLNQQLTGRLAVLIYLEPWTVDPGADDNNTVTGTLYCSNDAGFANYYFKGVTLKCGWNLIQMSRQDAIETNAEEFTWRKVGSPSWGTNMVRVRIRLEPQANNSHNVWICSLRDGAYYKPMIVFGFDDGLANTVNVAKPTMDTYGFKGTAYIISSLVGSSATYMTTSEITTLYNAGWDICNHTKTHQQNVLPTDTLANCTTEIQDCTNYIVAQGWNRRGSAYHFAAPYGEQTYYNATNYRNAITAAGMITARGTQEGVQAPFVDDGFALRCLLPDGSAETLASQQNRIKAAIGAGGSVLLLFHSIVTPADASTKWTPANFTALCQFVYLLKEAGIVDVVTMTEWYERTVGSSALTG